MRTRRFRDRLDAGAQLSVLLGDLAGRDVTVLGLPRGGVPVAGVVADRLGAPLDALIVRKIGVPSHRELAVGAIGPDGAALLDHDLMDRLGLSIEDLEPTIAAEREERHRRELAYREGREPPDLRRRHVLVVDDGLATGASMEAAVTGLR
ncbi:MAG: phosphoribosyltransferase, partial [Actinomycetes bacterium]